MGAEPLEVADEFGTAMSVERYDYSAMTPESVEREMTRAIEAADALVAQAVAARPPTFNATLRLLSDAGATP